jgi:hypothetical protein
MFMNDLLRTRLFILLTESSQELTNRDIQNAYVDFVKQVETISSENDYEKIYRNLSITRIEFASLESILQYEQGKKCA